MAGATLPKLLSETGRGSPEVHRRLAREAQEAGVSLNRLANAKLTQ